MVLQYIIRYGLIYNNFIVCYKIINDVALVLLLLTTNLYCHANAISVGK